jgi:hypothetical protein
MAARDRVTEQDLEEWADDLLTIPPSGETLPPDRTEEQWVIEFLATHGPGYYFYDNYGALHFKPRWAVDNMGGPTMYFSIPGYAKKWWHVNDEGVVVW